MRDDRKITVSFLQELAGTISNLLTDDRLFTFLALGLEGKDFICAFAFRLLETIVKHEGNFSLSSLADELWNHKAVQPIKAVLSKSKQIGRALLHFFCHPVPDGLPETTDTDIKVFTEYVGHYHVDKAISVVLRVTCYQDSTL